MNTRVPLYQGGMYRILYKIKGVQRKPRQSVMKLIDERKGEFRPGLIFSARPRFGTQEIPWDSIVELELVESDAQVYINWDPKSRKPPQSWPYQG